MEKVITLQLSYGVVKIYNLQKIWVQPMVLQPGFMLCYADDKYDKGIIYRSVNCQFLLKKMDQIYCSLEEGKKLIIVK